MYNKALGGIVSTAAYLLTVAAACSFPPDHPTISLNDLPVNEILVNQYDDIYVSTDTFSDCSGCVTEMSVCYMVFLARPALLSVLIINEESRIIHVYNTVAHLTSSDNQDTNCTVYNEFYSLCCLRRTLTPSEQFTVQSSHHFGLSVTYQVHSQHTTTSGYFTEGSRQVGYTLQNCAGYETVRKSYIYFNITPGECAPVSQSVCQVDQLQTTTGTGGTTEPTPSSSLSASSASDITPSSSHSTKTSVGENSTTSAMGAMHSSVPELRETDTHTATALLAGASGGGAVVILLVTAVVILGITCTVKIRVNAKKKGNGTCLTENENNAKLSSNTAYACTNTVATQEVPVPITTTSNSAYARSGHVSTSDEIYSYIPDESDLASSWKNATCIPMSHNESYTVTTQVKEVPENGLLDNKTYVVNQLVYATASRDTEAVKPHETSPDKPSIETATNEAHVCSNPATDTVTSNEAYALSTLPANRSEVYKLYESVLGNIDV